MSNQLSPGVKILRRVVIIMGVLLVVLFGSLFIAVIYKFMHKEPVPVTAIVQNQPAPVLPATKCDFKAEAEFKLDGNIISSSVSDNILTITTGKKTKPSVINKIQTGDSLTMSATAPQTSQQIVIFDLCKGEVVSRVEVVE